MALGFLPARFGSCMRRDRPCPRRRAAERGYQFPPSDSDRHVALPCEGGLVKGTVPHRKRAVLTLKDGGPSAKGSPMTQASPLTRFGLVQLPHLAAPDAKRVYGLP